jgi:hypothetical protein
MALHDFVISRWVVGTLLASHLRHLRVNRVAHGFLWQLLPVSYVRVRM